MAKASSKKGGGNKSGSGGSRGDSTMDKIAKAAMSREMLAAGLTAAAAAIAASPGARRNIRDPGLDAADSASTAANQMMSSASRLGSLIAEAVADAAQRVLSGNWANNDNDDSGATTTGTRKPAARKTAKRKATPRKAPAKAAARKPAAAKSAAKPRATTAKPKRKATRRGGAASRKRTVGTTKAPGGGNG
jgi:hypothetical protein